MKADCRIYDGNAVIQMLPGPSGVDTYQDMASRFFGYILNSSGGALVMHIVFDKYLPDSIKNQNREKRGAQELYITYNPKLVFLLTGRTSRLRMKTKQAWLPTTLTTFA